MRATVTLSIHDNYINVVLRAYKQTSISYVEYSLFGAQSVNLIKEPCTLSELIQKVLTFNEEDRDVRKSYLEGFRGHFTFTYELINEDNITEFNVTESRMISPSHGGRSVSNAFKDKLFGKKIFMNLLNAASERDTAKLNSVAGALYSLGG